MIKQYITERSIPEPNSGCWLWMLATDRKGYGVARLGPKWITAHRLSFLAFNGEINQKHVLHKCDNPGCVNPEHLELGTSLENNRQSARRGRRKFNGGESNPCAVLKEEDVRLIFFDRRPQKDIARSYGVHPSIISRIKSGKKWTYLKLLNPRLDISL